MSPISHPCRRVLLIPGTLCTDKLWAGVKKVVDKSRRVQVDVVPAVQGAVSIGDVAANIKKRYLSEDGGTGTIVVGHSLGGYVALEIAKSLEKNLLGLGLVSSQVRPDSGRTRAVRYKLIELAQNSSVARVVRMQRKLLLHPTKLHCFPALMDMAEALGVDGFVEQQHVALSRTCSADFAGQTELPLWLCCGDSDALTPLLLQRGIAHKARNCVLDVVPGAGHMLPLESPELVAKRMLDWIDTLP
ncbi:hypothetical protein DIPPA_07180 [Diplonema papillatum]|nr:hypothetical protein DIPPA_07180 [Diplonema papillatum]